jgi:large conductance mechanosensitive channel
MSYAYKGAAVMFKEFKEFIMRGNVLDLAVGFIIGAAFTAIVNSLVNDVIMPPIGYLMSGIDFSEIAIVLKEASGDDPAVAINIGNFINALIQFLIIAIVVFLLVRSVNKLVAMGQKQQEVEEAATTKDCPFCKSAIAIEATRCPFCTSQLTEI